MAFTFPVNPKSVPETVRTIEKSTASSTIRSFGREYWFIGCTCWFLLSMMKSSRVDIKSSIICCGVVHVSSFAQEETCQIGTTLSSAPF